MQRLQAAGYPVPRVFDLALTAAVLGQPFILMKRIESEPLWPRPATQPRLMDLRCGLMARLHGLDWRALAVAPDRLERAGPLAFVDAALARAQGAAAMVEAASFAPVVDWVRQSRAGAARARPAVVHGDFHPGNVLLRLDGAAVVIDWPGLDVSDARFHLGWTLMLAQAHAGADMRAALLAGYERASGARVEGLAYFEVFACLRRLLDVAVSLTQGAARRGRRPEAEAQMRAQRPAVLEVSEMLRERTGLAGPDLRALLE